MMMGVYHLEEGVMRNGRQVWRLKVDDTPQDIWLFYDTDKVRTLQSCRVFKYVFEISFKKCPKKCINNNFQQKSCKSLLQNHAKFVKYPDWGSSTEI